jgi:very-short-patch-repair endonuclease
MGKTAGYVIELLQEILGPCVREMRFPWAVGDVSPTTKRAVPLPFDAVWEKRRLIVEIDEEQHQEATPLFDKPGILTVSGVDRGEQRREYDARKHEAAIANGYLVVRLPWSRRRKPAHGDAEEIRALLESAGVELLPSSVSRDQAESLLRAALNDLETRDAHLLAVRANERSITHRLAVHLEMQLREWTPSWSVDCEFNRDDGIPKRLFAGSEKYARGGSIHDLVMDSKGRTVFPDIIVHVRGRPGPNLLVIEAKWEGADEEDVELDRQKLRAYIAEYKYAHAYLVLLRVNGSTIDRIEASHSE